MNERAHSPPLAIDLENCDREPIHIPGSIQPHGVLLACRPADLTIEQVSDNLAASLGVAVEAALGLCLFDLFEADDREELETVVRLEYPNEGCPIHVRARSGRTFEAVVHRSADVLIVELEDAVGERNAFHPQLRRSVARLHNAETPDELCRIAVREVRALTGFDRVMAYRFDDEWNGRVVAEAKSEQLSTFLGQQYPASDIPAQARRLYTVNWLRFVVDSRYRPARLCPAENPRTQAPLDLSFSVLRSVSPIHCQYLQNMGVAASMSVSLVHEGKLWGLIACHHYAGPRRVSYAIRDSCEFLARTLSWQIGSHQHTARAKAEAETTRIERRLYDEMVAAEDFLGGLVNENLLALTDAQGAAVLYEGNVRRFGQTPSDATIREIASWLESRVDDGVFVTDRLPKLLETQAGLEDSATGLLAVAISPAHGDYVLWFRASTETVVDWAGHPYKNVKLEDGVPRLSPRGSFELWRETVRGRSLTWHPWQVQGAVNVRRAVLGGVRRRAAEVQAFNEKLVEFDRAKDRFIASVSHELRTPLHAILGWVELIRSGSADEPRRAHGLNVIQRNAQAQAQLVDDLIDMSRMANGKFTLSLEPMSLAQVVEQAVESITPTAEAKGVRLVSSVNAVGATMHGDQRRLQQVVWNLLNNAIKFTPKQGTIELVLARRDSHLELTVADSGEGIAPAFLPYVFEAFRQAEAKSPAERKGLGLGLSISRHIVEAHGGSISVESPGPGRGSKFTVKLPA
ncbi:MAG TPA: ATP-binding protein [Polyangiaceae bacterium]